MSRGGIDADLARCRVLITSPSAKTAVYPSQMPPISFPIPKSPHPAHRPPRPTHDIQHPLSPRRPIPTSVRPATPRPDHPTDGRPRTWVQREEERVGERGEVGVDLFPGDTGLDDHVRVFHYGVGVT